MQPELLKQRLGDLHEVNPMLGHRGCRLAVTYPELAEMQAEAIIGSVMRLQAEGIESKPEIMIPLVSTVEEFKTLKDTIQTTISELEEKKARQ